MTHCYSIRRPPYQPGRVEQSRAKQQLNRRRNWRDMHCVESCECEMRPGSARCVGEGSKQPQHDAVISRGRFKILICSGRLADCGDGLL